MLNARSKTERLLKHELWRGQQRGGVGSPVHSRHIGSRFSLVPSAPFDTGASTLSFTTATSYAGSSSQKASNTTDMALFVGCSNNFINGSSHSLTPPDALFALGNRKTTTEDVKNSRTKQCEAQSGVWHTRHQLSK